ncbi:MAG: 30S ribosomal protein S6 [Hyphomicrobiales bacterium]|nr:MAG: 30S ribosomal protein S6 [Hyphomicrobiales bacterium]
MPKYEHIILARQDISTSQVETLIEDFTKVIDDNEGKVEKVESWGLRNIAYRIKKNRKAHYTLMNIECPPAAMKELERQQSINEDILRVMTIKVDTFEEGQSAVLSSKNEKKTRR